MKEEGKAMEEGANEAKAETTKRSPMSTTSSPARRQKLARKSIWKEGED